MFDNVVVDLKSCVLILVACRDRCGKTVLKNCKIGPSVEQGKRENFKDLAMLVLVFINRPVSFGAFGGSATPIGYSTRHHNDHS